ncbi:MAG TPA: hypothetical protein VJ419_04185 [Gaiellaceae bacterium]|nr:hypothetical protein [Gaiellaceae bacterium]
MAEGNGSENVEQRPAEAPRRVWFHVEDVELKWLRIGETAFLLWVLAGLVVAWLVVALVFLLI